MTKKLVKENKKLRTICFFELGFSVFIAAMLTFTYCYSLMTGKLIWFTEWNLAAISIIAIMLEFFAELAKFIFISFRNTKKDKTRRKTNKK